MSRHQLAAEIGYNNPGSPGNNQVRRWRAFAVLAVSFFMTVADHTAQPSTYANAQVRGNKAGGVAATLAETTPTPRSAIDR
jgi:hypothetical protein